MGIGAIWKRMSLGIAMHDAGLADVWKAQAGGSHMACQVSFSLQTKATKRGYSNAICLKLIFFIALMTHADGLEGDKGPVSVGSCLSPMFAELWTS